ncbi:VOC family protein [Candidatus Nucleicultrix amoebiphila]|jgi:catechol 2,3-dioxygenase-like lactoylglutathione lyase family enzyme|uniref:VOC domain-containing protein n=1 Tax=Candidatus Nucleicultrix amoebiphila FS5 TaxID=1414854 RepID=A0A1W6N5S7_9PROT|nr:VOC family protein [Candidatus Nucleicultrix amoebiphila]ARN85132.1 hypothetical protein GQ61_07375 [Candidatus Nucleicultrix amoebiphila FS5]
MFDTTFVILYVDNPTISASFYEKILGKPPVENFPTFAMFALSSGVMLGLWSHETIAPKATASGGGSEVAFTVPNREDVKSTYDQWKKQNLPIIQEPTEMVFGYTFVGLDPDGHRLRVFCERK